ncbi:MAG: glycosyltransferase, partial [Alphaproteobacteria bacterium]|nr:glycosyltransferase [Alphaproteobacteria bacterium]
MRILIDLQSIQGGSKNRGIGRYALSLTQSMVKHKGDHDILILINGSFADTVDSIKSSFEGLIPKENIFIFYDVKLDSDSRQIHLDTSEFIREKTIEYINPDVVLLTSLFEGNIDSCITSIHKHEKDIPIAVVFYDLIPLVFSSIYLQDCSLAPWYHEKIDNLARADCLLAISEATKQDGITHLNFSDHNCINISTGSSSYFRPIELSENERKTLFNHYGIQKSFVMYSGGVDYRKNLEFCIKAYSLLDDEIRKTHQLVFVFSVHPDEKNHLKKFAKKCGLRSDEFICTGYVPDEDLLKLYNLCKVFVFPSLYEGFGLPVLEAMQCGRAVIGSNVSSVPEIIVREDALFDPKDENSFCQKLKHVLVDNAFRKDLEEYGLERAKNFSWDETAKKTIKAMEDLALNHPKKNQLTTKHQRLAYISLLPPEKSGISDYSAELLPELAHHYDIEVIVNQKCVTTPWILENCPVRTVDWFCANASTYDRILYHFDNSHVHTYMFDLLNRIPGVVVLHDFFLSGVLNFLRTYDCEHFTEDLYRSHGYKAIFDYIRKNDHEEIITKYPCNYDIFKNSLGIIVHSEHSQKLSQKWYNDCSSTTIVPLLCAPANISTKTEIIKNELGYDEENFIICSFGLMDSKKLSHRVLDAFLGSDLVNKKNCLLVFVGDCENLYGKELIARINELGLENRIRFTGWTDEHKYRQYLKITDIAIQLRTQSRGETSKAILDCMNHGIPTIINAHGSATEHAEDSVYRIPDNFIDAELITALEDLHCNKEKREALGHLSRQAIIDNHSPKKCAELYKESIEAYYQSPKARFFDMVNQFALFGVKNDMIDIDYIGLSRILAMSAPNSCTKTIFIDVSDFMKNHQNNGRFHPIHSLLHPLIFNTPKGYRAEPVYLNTKKASYKYARSFVFNYFYASIKENPYLKKFKDDSIDYQSGDIFLTTGYSDRGSHEKDCALSMKNHGVQIAFFDKDLRLWIEEN